MTPDHAAGRAPPDARLRVRGGRGDVQLQVRLTPSGPVLVLSGAALEVCAPEELTLACASLRLRTAASATITAGGALSERIAGGARRTVVERDTLVARAVTLTVSPGGVELRANDDVTVRGDKIQLDGVDEPAPEGAIEEALFDALR